YYHSNLGEIMRKICTQGRVTIPKAVWERYGLVEGCSFVIDETSQGILFKPVDSVHPFPRVFSGFVARFLGGMGFKRLCGLGRPVGSLLAGGLCGGLGIRGCRCRRACGRCFLFGCWFLWRVPSL